MTLGELVDSGIKLGIGKRAAVFVSAPFMNTNNEECVFFLDGILKNRENYQKVFDAKVTHIYPQVMWAYTILQIDLEENWDIDAAKEAILNGGRMD